jgi:hypothetical protein
MDHREVLARRIRNRNMRDTFGRRQRREESEREIADGLSKLNTIRPVPGVDRIERTQFRDLFALNDTEPLQASVNDGARAISEANQRQDRPRRPDFGIVSPRRLKGRQRKNHISDCPWPYQQSAMHICSW